MNYSKLFSFSAFVAAVAILGISLISAGQVASYGSPKELRQSNRSFYVADEILPDHIMYPALMVVDKVTYHTAVEDRRPELVLKYAWMRLHAAEKLHQKHRQSLAVTTTSKGQKYLLEYCHTSDTVKADHIRAYIARSRALREQITSSNARVIKDLNTQLTACLAQHV